MKIVKNIQLQKYNTFGVKALAKYFVEIDSIEELRALISASQFQNEKSLVIGGGSNLLFTNDFDGIVIKINIDGIHVVKEDDKFMWVKAGAGVEWHELVLSCIKANLGGIENLSLIPGSVGAAPIQNIGAYGVELKDVFEALEAINLETGEKRYFRNKECEFSYRESIFKTKLKNKYIITNVVLRLTKQPFLNLEYGKIKEVLQKHGESELTLKDVSDAVIEIRQSKLPDPAETGNAGSFFKNPIVSIAKLNSVQEAYEDVPSYALSDEKVKIPAAWLIDQCGLKGVEHKGAAVHINQPLVLINKSNASGEDIVELSRMVQQKVKDKFDIQLDPEVSII